MQITSGFMLRKFSNKLYPNHKNSSRTWYIFMDMDQQPVPHSKSLKHCLSSSEFIVQTFLGWGLSSRNQLRLEDREYIVNYYIDTLEQWRKSQNLSNFTLVGHSFGGFISCLYAMQYPQYVNQLFLVSPCGITHRSEEEIQNFERDYIPNAKFRSKILYYVIKYAWLNHYSFSEMYQMKLFPGKFFLARWVKYWFPA